MRKFRAIIQTNIEPEDLEVLWYYKKTLKYYSDGSWRLFIIQDTDTIPIKDERLPNINNLTTMLDYLLKESTDFRIVNTLEDLNNISISLTSNNNICYVTSTDSLYIYKDNIWQQYTLKNTKILTERVLVKDVDTSSREIKFSNNLRKYEYIYLAYGDNISSLDNLTIYRVEDIDRHWIIPEEYELPKVGLSLYLVAVSSQELYIPVVISNSDLHLVEIRYYKNTDESIFKESIDIREFIYDLKNKVNELFKWKSQIDSQQNIQDANIQKNYIYSKELNAKIDAKVIEAGGVPFDIEPIENSKNAVFSGGVYKYINGELDKIEDNINDFTDLFTNKKSIVWSDGGVTSSDEYTNFYCTDFIPVKDNIIKVGTYSNYNIGMPFAVYYDKSYKKVGIERAEAADGTGYVYKEFQVNPPANAYYIRVNGYNKPDSANKCYIKIENIKFNYLEVVKLHDKTEHNSEIITDYNNKVLNFILEQPITEVLEHKFIAPNLQIGNLIQIWKHTTDDGKYLSVVKAEVKEGDKVEAKFYQTSAIGGLIFTDELGKVLFTETELNLKKETRYYIAPPKSYYVYTNAYPEDLVLKIYRDRNNSQCVDEIDKLRINQYFYKTEADYEIIEGYFNGADMTIGETYPLWRKMFITNKPEQNTCIVPIEDFYNIYYTGRAATKYTRAYYFFDDNDVLLDYRPNNENKIYVNSKIEIPKGAKYVILQSTSVDKYPLSFKIEIPKGEYLDSKIDNINNNKSEAIYPLKNKRILMLGDSITEFRNSKNMRISDYFKELSNATVYNCGVGGAQLERRKLVTDVSEITSSNNAYACLDVVSIVDGFVNKDITLQETAINYLIEHTTDNNSKILEEMKKVDLDNIDIITIFAGTNSYTSNVNIEDTEDINTVGNLQGAINHIVKVIHTYYPNITIYFFTPIPRMFKVDGVWQWSDDYMPTNITYKLYDLCAAIEKAAKRNHVNACDLYWGLGWNKYNFMNFSNDAKTDGTHPHNGLNRIASKMYHFIVSNLNQI